MNPYTRCNRMRLAWNKYTGWAEFHNALSDFKEFDTLAQKLWDRESFHIARYNDGEWMTMLKIEPFFTKILTRNEHDHDRMHQFSLRLLRIIESVPEYIIGVDSATRAGMRIVHPVRDQVAAYLEPIEQLVYGDLFNAATIRWGVAALMYPLRDRHVILVGPEHFKELGIEDHIIVPKRDCWEAADRIHEEVDTLIKRYGGEHPVVIYSCSMLAKWLVDVFYHQYGDSITQMDVGSCLDPWCGVFSRPWHPNVIGYVQQRERVEKQRAKRDGKAEPQPGYGGWGYSELDYEVRHILD